MPSHAIPGGLQQVIGLIQENVAPAVLDRGLERQIAVAENREPDYLPIVFEVNCSPVLDQLTQYDYCEEFYSEEKMLANQLNALIGFILARSDAQLAVRANLGTAFLATVCGLEPRILPHSKPWLTDHLGAAGWRELDLPQVLDQLGDRGLFPKALALYAYYRDVLDRAGLGKTVHLHLPDTQGAFDLAHLIVGDELFTLLHDDPAFAEGIVQDCTVLYCRASQLLKQRTGEEIGRAYHGSGMYLARAGVRCCEDTATLIRPADVRRNVRPAIERIGQEFDGAFVHFCGRGQHLLQALLDLPQVSCFNFGDPGNYDFAALLPRLIETGKYYYGRIPRGPEEELGAYFARVLGYLQGHRLGLALMPDLDEPIDEARAAEIVALWHEAQDRYL